MLKGTWIMNSAKGPIYEEWKQDGTALKGRSYKLTGTDTVLFESIVLMQDDKGVYYIPSTENQNDKKPVTFTLISSENQRFVFENKLHDFPQRIIYQLVNSDSIAARIEGTVKKESRFVDYNYKRVQ